MKFVLPDLKYAYNAYEPHFDAKTMEIHHSKHHQAYTNNLNAALDKFSDYEDWDIEKLLENLNDLPDDLKGPVRNNGGGYYNHKIFWEILSPSGGGLPEGALLRAIERDFGSFDSFKSQFKETALKQFGSGWAWLVSDDGHLKVVGTPNQDSPITQGQKVLVGVDVWEHAYYLKFQNLRADYIDAFFNLVDWTAVANRL